MNVTPTEAEEALEAIRVITRKTRGSHFQQWRLHLPDLMGGYLDGWIFKLAVPAS